MNNCLLGLLVEFDEMGFAPTTLCEDAEEYAKEWKERLRNEIKALETEIATLKSNLKECEFGYSFNLQYEKKLKKEAESENAALRGRLENAMELPIKAGETIYLVINRRNVIRATVETIVLSSGGFSVVAVFRAGNIYNRRRLAGSFDFGKKWFISRNAALARLAELKGIRS